MHCKMWIRQKFAMQRICMLPGGDSDSRTNINIYKLKRCIRIQWAKYGNIRQYLSGYKRWKGHVCHFKPVEFLQTCFLRWGPTTLGRPQWGQQFSSQGHVEPWPSCQKCQVYLEQLSVGGQITAMAPWDAEKRKGMLEYVRVLRVMERYNFPLPADFLKLWWYATALSKCHWIWSNSLGYYFLVGNRRI